MIEIRKIAKAGDYEGAQELILDTISEPFPRPTDPVAAAGVLKVLNEWAANCHMWVQPARGPTWGVYVAWDDGKPVGWFLLVPPLKAAVATCCDPPYIQFLANKGGPLALRAMLDEMKRIVKEAGFNSYVAQNSAFGDHADDAFARAYAINGTIPRRIGSLFEFHFEDPGAFPWPG
jgi:hypothetical protein